MSDLVTALGLVLVIEGLIWAAFPRGGVALLRLAADSPESSLRTSGAIAMAVGVAIVWVVRG
jgi:uncharacterized protein